MLSNFSATEKAMKEMECATGRADAEMDIVEQSITYKLNNLQQTWVGTIHQLIDRGDIGAIVDGLTKISEALGL